MLQVCFAMAVQCQDPGIAHYYRIGVLLFFVIIYLFIYLFFLFIYFFYSDYFDITWITNSDIQL